MSWASPRLREFLNATSVQVVIWVTVLLILLVVGYYVVQKFRDQSDDDRLSSNQLLTNFREMNEQGDISDTEFRKLKTVLGDQLTEELTDTGEGS